MRWPTAYIGLDTSGPSYQAMGEWGDQQHILDWILQDPAIKPWVNEVTNSIYWIWYFRTQLSSHGWMRWPTAYIGLDTSGPSYQAMGEWGDQQHILDWILQDPAIKPWVNEVTNSIYWIGYFRTQLPKFICNSGIDHDSCIVSSSCNNAAWFMLFLKYFVQITLSCQNSNGNINKRRQYKLFFMIISLQCAHGHVTASQTIGVWTVCPTAFRLTIMKTPKRLLRSGLLWGEFTNNRWILFILVNITIWRAHHVTWSPPAAYQYYKSSTHYTLL